MNDVTMEPQFTQSEKEEKKTQRENDGLSRIFNLPTELVEMILCYLDDESLLCIRHVCQLFRNLSLSYFGTRYFETVTAILHPHSLGVLVEIATHPELSKFVTRLTISGEKLGNDAAWIDCIDDIEAQEKMEISGSDRVMLGTIFSKLINLKIVRLDNMSYFYKPKGLCCGKQDTMKRRIWKWGTNKIRHEKRRNPVHYLSIFGTVFSIVEYSPNHKMITWELQFDKDLYHSPSIILWDPYTEEWVQRFARKVQSLEFQPGLGRDFPWVLDLLHFVDRLERFENHAGPGILELSHPITGMFYWPKLSRFSIRLFNTRHEVITDFLYLHRATLSDLELDHIKTYTGSWKAALQVMANMPKLQHIRFDNLINSDTNVPSYEPCEEKWLERVFLDKNFSASSVESSSREDVKIILQAITSRLRYEAMGRVNMRLACAAIQGVVEYADGLYLPKRYSVGTEQ